MEPHFILSSRYFVISLYDQFIVFLWNETPCLLNEYLLILRAHKWQSLKAVSPATGGAQHQQQCQYKLKTRNQQLDATRRLWYIKLRRPFRRNALELEKENRRGDSTEDLFARVHHTTLLNNNSAAIGQCMKSTNTHTGQSPCLHANQHKHMGVSNKSRRSMTEWSRRRPQ